MKRAGHDAGDDFATSGDKRFGRVTREPELAGVIEFDSLLGNYDAASVRSLARKASG